MLSQQNIKGDWRVFIGSSSLPPAVALVLSSPTTNELVQERSLRSVWLQFYRAYITKVGLSSCRAMTNAILLWFFIIHAITVSVIAALFVLDNHWMTLSDH